MERASAYPGGADSGGEAIVSARPRRMTERFKAEDVVGDFEVSLRLIHRGVWYLASHGIGGGGEVLLAGVGLCE